MEINKRGMCGQRGPIGKKPTLTAAAYSKHRQRATYSEMPRVFARGDLLKKAAILNSFLTNTCTFLGTGYWKVVRRPSFRAF
jgi:hypothetical protein